MLLRFITIALFSITLNTYSQAIVRKHKINWSGDTLLVDSTKLRTVASSGMMYCNSKVALTPEGGIAVRLINRTGSVSVKGEVVCPSRVSDTACTLITVDRPDPMGVMYESGVANGSPVWVVIHGVAQVYFVGSVTRGNLVRGFLTSDGGSYVIGQATNEAVPTAPFATDKHFYEIGHAIESRTGAGLARCVLHYN